MRTNIEILSRIPAFANLTTEALAQVDAITTEVLHPEGEFLFRENDPGDRVYIIKSGRVKVFRTLDNRNQALLGFSGPGELIGEMSILERESRSASVVAVEDTYTLEIVGEDFKNLIIEMGEIGYQFIKILSHRMRQAGDDRQSKAVEMAKFEREMEIARRIQASFLPGELPQPKGWEIAARFHPARAVGGDFYDAFPLSRDRVGVVIADISGKGAGAALFMALFRSLLRAFAAEARPLGWLDILGEEGTETPWHKKVKRQRDILSTAGGGALLAVEDTNNYIATTHSDSGMFATMFFGVLDPKRGTLTYINAGHNPPVIVRTDGSLKARLNPTGPVVGMMPVLAIKDIALHTRPDLSQPKTGLIPDLDFEIERVTLGPGDCFVGFTDGVPDARSPGGEFFTEERLVEFLAGLPDRSAGELLSRIENTLFKHIDTASQFDDMTLIGVKRNSG